MSYLPFPATRSIFCVMCMCVYIYKHVYPLLSFVLSILYTVANYTETFYPLVTRVPSPADVGTVHLDSSGTHPYTLVTVSPHGELIIPFLSFSKLSSIRLYLRGGV